MEQPAAHEFVQGRLAAWNGRDVEAALAHFADDVTFTSPVVARIVAGSDGVLRKTAALRARWSDGSG